MDKEYRKLCFEHVFLNQKWGDSTNSGRKSKSGGNYERRYSKTKKDKGLIKVDSQGRQVKKG